MTDTRLRDLSDAQTEVWHEQLHKAEAFEERVVALMMSKKPWAWSSLPGYSIHHVAFFISDERIACQPRYWVSCERRREKRATLPLGVEPR